ncbi:MAG: hypothetical protein WCT10_03235 [Patescibacteria group bacterium]|jgi:hypothetical protein
MGKYERAGQYGINWDDILRKEYVSRLAAAPFFEEAGSLLMSAGLIWQGRLGAGRIRGQELTTLGYTLREAGRNWRHGALSWSPPPEWESCYSHLLAEFRDHRSFSTDRRNSDQSPRRHPQAARTLVAATIALVQDQLPVIGATGRHLYRDDEVKKCEDLLETLGEHPASEQPDLPLTQARIDLLGLRAAYRTCEGLCCSVGTIWIYAQTQKESSDREPATKLWYTRGEAFRELAKAAYLRFAAGQPESIRDSLLDARDDAIAYGYDERHYASRDEIAVSEKLAEALIDVLLQLTGERYGREAAADAANIMRIQALPAAESSDKQLTPPPKQLAEPKK